MNRSETLSNKDLEYLIKQDHNLLVGILFTEMKERNDDETRFFITILQETNQKLYDIFLESVLLLDTQFHKNNYPYIKEVVGMQNTTDGFFIEK